MTKDRLPELQQILRQQAFGSIEEFVKFVNLPEIPLAADHSTDADECHIIQELQSIEGEKIRLNIVKSTINEIAELQGKIVELPRSDQYCEQHLDELSAQVRADLNHTRRKLKEWQTAVENDPGASARSRILKFHHSILLNDFLELFFRFNNGQNDFKDRCKQRIRRQLEIAGRFSSHIDVERVIETGDLTQLTLHDIYATPSRDMLANVQARHQNILQVEQSVQQLHEMFEDIEVLVIDQGHSIRRVEDCMYQTMEYMDDSVVHLRKAVKFKRRHTKKKAGLAVVIMVVLGYMTLRIF